MPVFDGPGNPDSPALKRYAAFVAQNGELFERKVVPMDAEDLKEVEYNYRFTKRITIPVIGAICVGVVAILIIANAEWFKLLGGGLCVVAIGGFLKSMLDHYKELLEKKEKIIVRGVVTRKKDFKRGGYYYLFLSEREEVLVDKKDFNQCRGGEVIEVSFLSKDRPLRKSFKIITTIP